MPILLTSKQSKQEQQTYEEQEFWNRIKIIPFNYIG